MQLSVSFNGGFADNHRIQAVEGSLAIEGIARSILISSHYLVTSEVRQKAPFSQDVTLLLTALEPGSFKANFEWITKKSAVVTTLGGIVIGSAISGPVEKISTDFVSYVINRTLGNEIEPETDVIKELVEARKGDTQALMQNITPAMKRSHKIIGNGVSTIVIVGGSNNIVNLDLGTKDYINSDQYSRRIEQKVVRVSRINGNANDVGVYDLEEKRVIARYLPSGVPERTMPNLGRSLTFYLERNYTAAEVNIKYRRVTDKNGRIVRYTILDAWFPEPENAWEDIFGERH